MTKDQSTNIITAMSPDRKIYIRPDAVSAFNQAIKPFIEQGQVEILKEKESIRDHEVELDDYLSRHRERVSGLNERKNPEIEAKIARGYSQFLFDYNSSGFHAVPVYLDLITKNLSQEENLQELRKITADVFIECTMVKPSYIDYPKLGRVTWLNRGFITPRKAEAIIQRYGLLDGERKDFEEIAGSLKVSLNRVKQIIHEAFNILRMSPFPKKEHHPESNRRFDKFIRNHIDNWTRS